MQITPFRVALIAVVVLGLAGTVAGEVISHQSASLADARARLTITQAQLATVVLSADVATHVADSAKAVGTRALAQRDSILRASHWTEEDAAAFAEQFQAVVAAEPDTCALVSVAAEKALAAKDAVIGQLHQVVAADSVALGAATFVADTLRTALVRLRSAAVSVSQAATQLDHATRPSFLSRVGRFLPRPGVGAAAGVDATGQPRVVIGVTFGWSL